MTTDLALLLYISVLSVTLFLVRLLPGPLATICGKDFLLKSTAFDKDYRRNVQKYT